MTIESDRAFTGTIAGIYDACMGPMFFAPYAQELARRAQALAPKAVLETAAGTGIVTAALRSALGREVPITATDLNPGMLEVAARKPTLPNVTWQQADAQALPFPDGAFDLLVCQFGVMFFPDRPRAYREARRVLAPGGTLLLAVWDALELNGHCEVVQRVLTEAFPKDPPQFLRRGPFGYHDTALITRELEAAGFERVACEKVALVGRSPTARIAAEGLVQGSPMRSELEAHGSGVVERITDAAEKALASRFGNTPLAAPMAAIVVTARA